MASSSAASLGQLAVVLKLISRDEHRELSRRLQAMARAGRPVSYARLLVRSGIPAQTVQELLRRGADLEAVRCDGCGASIPQSALRQRREYPCLRCGAMVLGFRAYTEHDPAPDELPTVPHGQVLALPGQRPPATARPRRVEIQNPWAAEPLTPRGDDDGEDTTRPDDGHTTLAIPGPEELGVTVQYKGVLLPPLPVGDDAGELSTMRFGGVLRVPAQQLRPRSEEESITAFGEVVSDQGELAPAPVISLPGLADYGEIDGFKVERLLGEGGMGRVYLAREGDSGRSVALKVLRPQLAEDTEYLERFHREARSLEGLEHPNVVGIVKAGHDRRFDLHYIAFEYMAGGTLEARMQRERTLPEREVLQLALGIARALEFTSGRGIVHRDVKPANILLDGEGRPKLADLGLARYLDRVTRVTQAGIVLGTPAYLAPEQATDVADIDVRADLYALGVVCWEMLTGQLPLEEGASTQTLVVRHVDEDVPDVRLFRPDASPEIAQLVAGLTARKRKERYPNAEAVVAEVERVLSGEQPLGARASNKQEAKRPRPSSGGSSPARTAAKAGSGSGSRERPAPLAATVDVDPPLAPRPAREPGEDEPASGGRLGLALFLLLLLVLAGSALVWGLIAGPG